MKVLINKKKLLLSILLTLLYIAASLITTAITSPLNTTEVTVTNYTVQLWNDFIQLLLILPFSIVYYRDPNIHIREAISIQKPVVRIIGLLSLLFVVLLVAFESSFNSIYASLYYLIIVAAGEEYVFRGYLYRNIRENASFGTAVLMSGLVFGLAHGSFQYFILQQSWLAIPSNLGGGIIGTLLFAYLLEKSGTLLIPILVHWLLDFCGYIF